MQRSAPTTHRRGKNHESFRRIAAFDNFDCPIAVAGNRLAQLRAGIGTIGKQVTQPGEPVANGLDERACAIAVLNVGRGNDHKQQQSDRVDNNVALATLDLFSGVISANAPAFQWF